MRDLYLNRCFGRGTTTATFSFSTPTGGSGNYKYSYDFNNDGTFEITNSTNPTATVPESYLDDGPSTRIVHGRIRDNLGAYADYTATISVVNVSPSPAVTCPWDHSPMVAPMP